MPPLRQHSLNAPDVERETLEADVLLVGAGPANLACAIHLQRLLKEQGLGERQVIVLEKGAEVGDHTLSGAVMDPRGMAELFPEGPDWRARGCPVEAEVRWDALDVLFAGGRRWRVRGPLVPPQLKNRGKVIVTLSRVVQWMKGQAEAAGAQVFPGFAAAELLFEGEGRSERVVGVTTRDAGLDRHGERKGGYQPGMHVRARVTVLGEGPRGHLTKHLVQRHRLDEGRNPQTYGTGIKELWEVPPERGAEWEGGVVHTMGAPLGTSGYGGGWIYGLPGNRLSIGFVVGLDHHDARLDPHALFVRWKQHPSLARILAGGKVLRYGAKTVPEGGYFAMPRLFGEGYLIVGDSAGFLNASRLKGIHLAIRSGMLAAETIAQALAADDASAEELSRYGALFEADWTKQELWRVRNFRQAFDQGLFPGMFDAGIQMLTGGRGLVARRPGHADHETMRPLADSRMERPVYDDAGSMDKLTDVFHSGTTHEEDQPAHLLVTDPSICVERCTAEYGNPCRHFCPAAVYEWPEGHVPRPGQGPVINFSNCVHCKTCDIADPYGIIEWVVPEGGGGPKYVDL